MHTARGRSSSKFVFKSTAANPESRPLSRKMPSAAFCRALPEICRPDAAQKLFRSGCGKHHILATPGCGSHPMRRTAHFSSSDLHRRIRGIDFLGQRPDTGQTQSERQRQRQGQRQGQTERECQHALLGVPAYQQLGHDLSKRARTMFPKDIGPASRLCGSPSAVQLPESTDLRGCGVLLQRSRRPAHLAT